MRPSFEKNQLEIIKLKRNRIIFKRATLRRLRQILLGVLQSSLRQTTISKHPRLSLTVDKSSIGEVNTGKLGDKRESKRL